MRSWLLFALLSSAAWGNPTPADFHYSQSLITQSGSAQYQLSLPLDVYQHSQRSDLGDLRVFNAAGELVPYTLRTPSAIEAKQQAVSLPFFPQTEQQSTAGSRTQIQRNPDGSLLQITQQALQKDIVTYLVDASKIKTPLSSITFAWQNPEYSGTVIIEASDDLQQWRELQRGNVLKLQYQNQQLAQQTLVLPNTNAKYLRLSWPDGAPQLQSVDVGLHKGKTQTPHEWQTAHISKSEQGALFFKTLTATPVDQMRITLPEINTVVRAQLYSRQRSDAAWQSRWQGVLYRLMRNTVELNNTPPMFSPNGHTKWKLQLDTQGGGVGNGQVKIEMGWTPSTLIFVARGDPPFTLAYGNKTIVSAAQSEVDLLLTPSSVIANASVASAVLNPNPTTQSDPAQQKKWLLWGALLVAVGVLAVMARSLIGQLKSPTQ
ncbi:DUF3999 domain-containing protein [Deefgea tanakiae]|uniref:DUF3999 domain-containing protein n=1 Tax=Deefgea tanakiae TaxID=2865840 RepID=A0ABX8Z6L2_9NEIS|nr:DUF3999 domain-containing protein [Deefgea tanakiae]QZA76800.1 DUF3999 domain-containing protein [Deefgea tanakiae]